MTQETKEKIYDYLSAKASIHLSGSTLLEIERIILRGLQQKNITCEKPLILKDGTKTFIIKRSDVCGIEYEKDRKMIMLRRYSGEHHSFAFSENEEVLENFIQDFKDGF